MINEITIIAFNYGYAGRVVNGPGMCLVNFVKKLKIKGVKVNVFTYLKSDGAKPLSDFDKVSAAIKKSDVLQHWSGISDNFIRAINYAKKLNKKIIIGPNVLDTVEYDKEVKYLRQITFNKILTVNEKLKFGLSKKHNIPLNKIGIFMVGPDEELWSPSLKDNGKILWKGNSKQFVKDIQFGLDVAIKLNKYEFEFLGYPNPYEYYSHISKAKDCHLYISTSLSETMSLTLAESWCSGLPSVTHPKIYLHGINYETGIIVSRDVDSYCEAIEEIMENGLLYQELKLGAINYMKNNFSNLIEKYIELIDG